MAPLVRNAGGIVADVIGPLRFPRHPLQSAAFGRYVPYSAERLVRSRFSHAPARALLGGIAAHAFLPLDRIPTAAFGLLLGLLGHAYGWPVVRGGSQRLSDALAAELTRLGGEIVTGWRVASLDELPPSDAVLLDLTPRQVLAVTGDRLPARYRRRLARFRYGPGVFKVDWALDGPIPWTAEACSRAGTVHVVGDLDDILAAERDVAAERIPARPFVLLAQPSVADPTRAPEGTQTIWAYCHVPHGSPVDMTDAVEAQIERFAPGFRDRVLARSVLDPAAIEHHNANHVGGDINGGLQDLRQLFTRPAARLTPYSTPAKGLYICSSSTPPGGGVHGMCGYFAAHAALATALH
jgi:phytoene dehydrogenase-like protein